MVSDPFRYDDAAYVLGALDPAERAAFETHLLSCEDCRARVSELAGVPSQLAGIDEAVVDPGPVPDTLLPGMLREARRGRARTRVVSAAVAGLAAAVAVVLTLVATRSPSAPPSGPAQAMHALVATPVHADVALTSEKWGTRVTLHCRYDTSAGAAIEYEMSVRDRQGDTYPLGGWRIKGGQDITYVAGAPVPTGDIARIDVTTPDGVPILRLQT
jgi:hypothetical protein